MYEAGAVDGVKNRIQELYYITLPSMRPSSCWGDHVPLLSPLQPLGRSFRRLSSTDYAAHTVVAHLLDYGNIRFEMGYASAIAVVLFITMVAAQRMFQRVLSKLGDWGDIMQIRQKRLTRSAGGDFLIIFVVLFIVGEL